MKDIYGIPVKPGSRVLSTMTSSHGGGRIHVIDDSGKAACGTPVFDVFRLTTSAHGIECLRCKKKIRRRS